MAKEEADPAEMEKEQQVEMERKPGAPEAKWEDRVYPVLQRSWASWGRGAHHWLWNVGITGPGSWWRAGVKASLEWVQERKGERVETESRQLFQGV